MPPMLNAELIAALQDAFRRIPSYKGTRRKAAPSATMRALQARLPKIIPAVILSAQTRGYSVAIHGSLSRDVDLVIVPWTSAASLTPPAELIRHVLQAVRQANGGYAELRDKIGASDDGVYVDLGQPGAKPHGRLGWSIYIDPDPDKILYLDISILSPYPAHDPYGEQVTLE